MRVRGLGAFIARKGRCGPRDVLSEGRSQVVPGAFGIRHGVPPKSPSVTTWYTGVAAPKGLEISCYRPTHSRR
jgi:hypothetical protein